MLVTLFCYSLLSRESHEPNISHVELTGSCTVFFHKKNSNLSFACLDLKNLTLKKYEFYLRFIERIVVKEISIELAFRAF